MKGIRAALVCGMLLGLAGCGALPPANLISPRVTFSELNILDIGLSEIRFALHVNAENPNEVDIPLRNVSFELELLGSAFAAGSVARDRIDLPARGRREIPIEFTVPTTRLVEVFGRLRGAGLDEPVYRLRGAATWGASGIAIPFERSGDLEALRRLRRILGVPPSRTHAPQVPRERAAADAYAISS